MNYQEYITVLDFQEQDKVVTQVTEKNYDDYLQRWANLIEKDILIFSKSNEYANLFNLKWSEIDLKNINITFQNWMGYLSNSVLASPKSFIPCRIITKTIERSVGIIQQFNELVVNVIDEIQRPFSHSYQQTYIRDQSERLFKEITKCGETLMKISSFLLRANLPKDDVTNYIFELTTCLKKTLKFF